MKCSAAKFCPSLTPSKMSITNVFKNCWKLSGKASREQKNNLVSLSLLKLSKLIYLSSVHLYSCLTMDVPKPKTPMTGAQTSSLMALPSILNRASSSTLSLSSQNSLELKTSKSSTTSLQLHIAREQWTALGEVQREVGINCPCPYFIFRNPPTPRCHNQGAGEEGNCEDGQGLCHHWFSCMSRCKVHLHQQGRGGV